MPKNSPAETSAALENVSFEEALKELEAIVRKLEGGNADLESSIQDYLRGTELKNYCDQKLKEARMKVEAIMKTQDGGLATKPLDAA
ncbi:MAG: exodeoxyribonuclease VII small subunit [Alphaproteobacteria bacterium]|nr:exodeoxyribonuclease VII small subunit [Alphaproteobacteria bacterium]